MKNASTEIIFLNTIKDWANINRKIFWKYEVSAFYQTYKISVSNLPNPLSEDVKVMTKNHLLNNTQKTQLCNVIKKACAKAGVLKDSYIDIKIDYVKGTVIAAFIHKGLKFADNL